MKAFPVPIVALGPGSQPAEEVALDYLHMDREVPTFSMPDVPTDADADAMTRARDLIASFLEQVERWDLGNGAAAPRLEMTGIDAAPLEIANEMLGEGEVSIRIRVPREVRVQETIFAGVWRARYHDDRGQLVRDELVASAIPDVVLEAAQAHSAPKLRRVDIPPGAMNSPALLREIQQRVATCRPGEPAHVVNLTLLPLTPEDHRVLDESIEVGPVAIISRGFGNCRITSTSVRNVWRVQYFNSMQTLILNTIEVVDVPEVALAAAEDLHDSRERLRELVAWMSESCGA